MCKTRCSMTTISIYIAVDQDQSELIPTSTYLSKSIVICLGSMTFNDILRDNHLNPLTSIWEFTGFIASKFLVMRYIVFLPG